MLTGSCLCGAVAYEADAPSSASCIAIARPAARPTARPSRRSPPCRAKNSAGSAAQDRLGAIESSPGKFRRFCTQCGSHIMAERMAQPVVLLRLGCLDTTVTDRPQVHIWRSDAASWYDPKQQFPEKPEGLT